MHLLTAVHYSQLASVRESVNHIVPGLTLPLLQLVVLSHYYPLTHS